MKPDQSHIKSIYHPIVGHSNGNSSVWWPVAWFYTSAYSIYIYIHIYIYIYLFLYIPLYSHIRGFHKWGYPKIDGVFFMDHPIEMDPSQVSARGPCHGWDSSRASDLAERVMDQGTMGQWRRDQDRSFYLEELEMTTSLARSLEGDDPNWRWEYISMAVFLMPIYPPNIWHILSPAKKSPKLL